jgi:single-stranded DNA-binding protein
MITITGDVYVVDDPVMKFLSNGSAVTSMRVRSPEGRDKVLWATLNLYGRSAEIANEFLHAGMGVSIVGSLRTRDGNPNAWLAKDGQPRSEFVIDVARFRFLSQKTAEQADPPPEVEA